ncbi:motility associated factor glycosyltransferase family protein [Butyrivibrio sp. AE3004]|uniref:motility associated factor glycosyltransferase family protein n=1 Tax=Butyrivibrio sp. AE3004 TaxID=1506994 RepID=UPI000493F964|nr:6-hydroxymethylpterin diphosphokinase MptE-like protein [Butyrivibrio sp. AE3004]
MLQKNEKIREMNFSAFKKRYGFRPQIDADEDKIYRMDIAQNGEPILFILGAAPGGRDLRMNSEYDPMYEAERWAEKFEFKNRRTTVLLLGFGAGYHLEALQKKIRPDTHFYIYEPQEDLFSFICAYIDITSLIDDRRIHLFVNDEQRGLYVNEAMMDIVTYNSETEGISTPFYASNAGFDESCEALAGIMCGQKNYQKKRGRISLKCRLYAWTHMRNAAILPAMREALPKDIPAVIVSAGPSLNKNVDDLKELKGRALIMCSDRALNVLNEHGIEPDVVLSAEPGKDPAFLNYPVAKHIPLLCSMQANSEAQKMFEGRCIYFHALHYEETLFGKKIEADLGGVDLGGNVSGACFVACEKLGIKTIILIGQDMAYLDGKHHADNSDSGGDDARNLTTIELPGINGGVVQSCGMWREFRDFFERRIKLNPELRVIDATEGGALIRGSEVMTLKAVSDELVAKGNTYNDAEELGEFLCKLPRAQSEEEYSEMCEKLNSWCDDLDMIVRNCEEIVTICNQLLKVSKYQDIRDNKNKKKLIRLDKLRAEIYSTTANALLEEYWVEDIYSIPDYTFMIRNNEEAIPVFENAISYYSHLPEDCGSLKEAILEAISENDR